MRGAMPPIPPYVFMGRYSVKAQGHLYLYRPQNGGHHLSAVRDCLFNIFAATLHIWRPCPPAATRGTAMLW